MKYLKKYENFHLDENKGKSSVEELNEDYTQQMTTIKNEYTKITNSDKKGMIEIGVNGKVSDILIKNLKQTYKDAVVKLVDDRWIMFLESHLNRIGNFKENFEKLTDDEKTVFNILQKYNDMSDYDCLIYATKDAYYGENDLETVAKEIRKSFEEDNAPSEKLLNVYDAISDGRLKITKSGKKMFGKLTLMIEEYVWARNYMDGYGIDVYDENDSYEGTIHLLAPNWKPEIYKS